MAPPDQEPLPLDDGRVPRRIPLRNPATFTIPEAAKLLGVGRALAYEIVARDGELAGVPVIRVGRRLVIPQARFLAVLGLDGPDPVTG